MKRRDFVGKWGLPSLKINLEFREGESSPRGPYRAAAGELYVELLTRVATPYLAPAGGDEKSVLNSVYFIFKKSDEIQRRHGSGFGEFARLSIPVLSQVVRPFASQWHRLSLAGAFQEATLCRGNARTKHGPFGANILGASSTSCGGRTMDGLFRPTPLTKTTQSVVDIKRKREILAPEDEPGLGNPESVNRSSTGTFGFTATNLKYSVSITRRLRSSMVCSGPVSNTQEKRALRKAVEKAFTVNDLNLRCAVFEPHRKEARHRFYVQGAVRRPNISNRQVPARGVFRYARSAGPSRSPSALGRVQRHLSIT